VSFGGAETWGENMAKKATGLVVLLVVSGMLGCSNSSPTNKDHPGAPPAPDPTPASRQDSLRKELEAHYALIVDGFKKNDPSVWEGFLVSDFQLKLFNGQVQNRQWVSDYVRNNAKTFKVVTLSMRIKDLKIEGDDAVAIVEQESSRTFRDEQGERQLDVGAIQRETWTKTPDGMRLKLVEEKEVLYLRKDGKPTGQ
jgi:hypothetical protein